MNKKFSFNFVCVKSNRFVLLTYPTQDFAHHICSNCSAYFQVLKKVDNRQKKLDSKRACQETDIPVKLINEILILFLPLSAITSTTLYSNPVSLQNYQIQMSHLSSKRRTNLM